MTKIYADISSFALTASIFPNPNKLWTPSLTLETHDSDHCFSPCRLCFQPKNNIFYTILKRKVFSIHLKIKAEGLSVIITELQTKYPKWFGLADGSVYPFSPYCGELYGGEFYGGEIFRGELYGGEFYGGEL
jgi:hypothetical protein